MPWCYLGEIVWCCSFLRSPVAKMRGVLWDFWAGLVLMWLSSFGFWWSSHACHRRPGIFSSARTWTSLFFAEWIDIGDISVEVLRVSCFAQMFVSSLDWPERGHCLVGHAPSFGRWPFRCPEIQQKLYQSSSRWRSREAGRWAAQVDVMVTRELAWVCLEISKADTFSVSHLVMG